MLIQNHSECKKVALNHAVFFSKNPHTWHKRAFIWGKCNPLKKKSDKKVKQIILDLKISDHARLGKNIFNSIQQKEKKIQNCAMRRDKKSLSNK